MFEEMGESALGPLLVTGTSGEINTEGDGGRERILLVEQYRSG
jgi:hypothetical protein